MLSDRRTMDYREARAYLEAESRQGSILGLDTMKELLSRLGNPQNDLKFIHLAGTNGKGSVLAFLSTVLKESNYRVGRYISPTLFSYREKIQVNGAYIEKEALARWVSKIKEVSDAMEQEGLARPTLFEIETALGFLYFKEKNCDLVVLETGMGGKEDATNVITTTVMEVFTSISMDHVGVLGNTLEEIAECKAGIIKPETLVVSADQKPEVSWVLRKMAEEQSCSYVELCREEIQNVTYGYEKQQFTYGSWKNVVITLSGCYQIENAALALLAIQGLQSLGYEIPEDAVFLGLAQTQWRGRFTLLRKDPIVIMDGAHNEDAALQLAKSIETYFSHKRIYYIMGVFGDKEYEKIIDITAPYAYKVTVIEKKDNPRALSKEILQKAWETRGVLTEKAESVQEALERTLREAEKKDVVIAFGSLSFLGEIQEAAERV